MVLRRLWGVVACGSAFFSVAACTRTETGHSAPPQPRITTVSSRQALSSEGLVAAYNFDEGSGLYAADSSGQFNDGTLLDEMWSASGKHGGAAAFDGMGQWITVARARLSISLRR